jgi:DNA-binding transcriptional MerR regulator
MDTGEVAALLGTTAKNLRRFLRSAHSTFKAVGSGARYEFTSRDVPTLQREFMRWLRSRQQEQTVKEEKPRVRHARSQRERDEEVWAEEGDVELPDIRDPQVLMAVRRAEAERVARLEERMMAAGLHVTQWSNNS